MISPSLVISDFRPDEIIMGYWRQVIDVENDAEILGVEFVEVV